MVTKTEMRWLYDLVYPYVCFLLILIDSKWSNPQALCSILFSVHCRRYCSIRTLWQATLWRRCPDICPFFSIIKTGTPKNAHRTPWLARWIPCIDAPCDHHRRKNIKSLKFNRSSCRRWRMVLEVHNMTRFKPNSIHVHMKQSCFMMDHVEKKMHPWSWFRKQIN